MMNKLSLILMLIFCSFSTRAQKIDKYINVKEATRIQKVLSSDAMEGRKTGTQGIEKAAVFIEKEFKDAKLEPFPGLLTFRQSFSTYKTKALTASGRINDSLINAEHIIAITTDSVLDLTLASSYMRLRFDSTQDLLKEASRILKEKKNYLVFVDPFHEKNFGRLKRFKREGFKMNYNVIFILSSMEPRSLSLNIRHEATQVNMANVIGMVLGKSRKDEFVIFSAHYDHLGIGKPNAAGDSVFNGANDDAAGTTAMMMLARYFNKYKLNERTLIFAAFTGEESGGYGSRYFSTQLNPDKVVAMFNIEMIGTESKWGKNSAYITGFDKSGMGAILQKNLEGSDFKFEPDPYPKQQLFYRSDNATLAALGVPAHTISTSKMDEDKFYHTQEDEIESLDMNNMTEIIKAIAVSSMSIISGKDTPSRVEKVN